MMKRCIALMIDVQNEYLPMMDEKEQVPAILERIRPGWSYLMERGLGSSLTGNVTRALTGAPLSGATVSVQEVVFLEGERRNPEPLFGGFTRLLQPGMYTVIVSCEGYATQVQSRDTMSSRA